MRAALLLLALQLAAAPGYVAEVAQWRAAREEGLRAPDGWLSLTGLFWLQEGANPAGSDEASRVRLPDGLPARAGVIEKDGSRLLWRPEGGASKPLKTDKSGSPDVIQIGRIRLHVIERGTKFGVRMKDPETEARRTFTGLKWFPIREAWRIRARFVAAPKEMLFDAQAGDKQAMTSPGYVEWEKDGRTLRLTPVLEEGQLFFVFRDTTAGRSTYPAGRFLYADLPKDGFVTVDFNKAYNPPCVFTPYATCPLPPPENRLPVAVEAGELAYH
jgi:uncharacterized protein